MERIYMNAVGIVMPTQYDSLEALVNNIMTGNRLVESRRICLDEHYQSRDFRRMDGFSIISMLSFQQVMVNLGAFEFKEYDCGTIVNTTYGPIETNIEFASDLAAGKGDFISPIVFSHTVNNAALGHICKKYRLKGPSTLVLSSNGISIAANLLHTNKVKVMFVGGVEQYCEGLARYFDQKDIPLTELAVTLALTKEPMEQSYSVIYDYYEENLLGHPYLEETTVEEARISNIMNQAVKRAHIQPSQVQYVIVNTGNENTLNVENKVAKELNSAVKVINLQESIGETLGASLTMNLAVAGLMCKQKKVEQDQYILVNHYDISGNFMTYVVGPNVEK